eukprot:6491847-Amphidinium_carterae.2
MFSITTQAEEVHGVPSRKSPTCGLKVWSWSATKVKRTSIAKQKCDRRKVGAWRAFVKSKCGGVQGRPNMKALARHFKALKETGNPLYDTYVAMGVALSAVAVHKRRQKMALVGKILAFQKSQSLLFYKRWCNSPFSDMVWAIERQFLGAEGAIGKAITWARTFQREQMEAERRKVEQARLSLEQFTSTLGKTQIEDMSKVYGFVSPATFQPLPLGEVMLLRHTPPTRDHAVRATNTALMDQKRSNLGVCMSDYWQQWHETVDAKQAQEFRHEVDTERLCQKEGICLCCGDGLLLKKLRNAVNDFMKQAFKKQQSLKALCKDGSCVLEFSHTMDTGIVADDLPSPAGAVRDEVPNVFLHVAMLYLSPFRATYHCVQRVQSPSMDEAALNRVFVKVLRKPCLLRDPSKFAWCCQAVKTLRVFESQFVLFPLIEVYQPVFFWVVTR